MWRGGLVQPASKAMSLALAETWVLQESPFLAAIVLTGVLLGILFWRLVLLRHRARALASQVAAHTAMLEREIASRKAVEESLAWEAAQSAAFAELARQLLSPCSLDEISDLFLQKLRALTGSPYGFVSPLNAAGSALDSTTLIRHLGETCPRTADSSMCEPDSSMAPWPWVIHNRTPLVSNDFAHHPYAVGMPEGHMPLQTVISAPALANDQWMGQLMAVNAENGYTARDLEGVERLAALYALAVQRAKSDTALRESAERFAAVTNSVDAPIYVADMETHELLFVNEHVRRVFGGSEGQICWQTLQADQTGPCDFCTNRYLNEGGELTAGYTWEFRNKRTNRWYFCHDRAVHWPDGRLVRLEVALDTTALKVAEARALYTEVRMAMLEERERMGRDLHDDLSQILAFVSAQTHATRLQLGQDNVDQAEAYLTQLADAVAEAVRTVRAYVDESRTAGAETVDGFFSELGQIADRLQSRYGLSTRVALPHVLRVPPPAGATAEALLRILQEALTNICKHAGVAEAQVVFAEQGDDWVISVTDTGHGFAPVPCSPAVISNEWQGFDIMHERAAAIGGTVRIESAPGQGTVVLVRAPVPV